MTDAVPAGKPDGVQNLTMWEGSFAGIAGKLPVLNRLSVSQIIIYRVLRILEGEGYPSGAKALPLPLDLFRRSTTVRHLYPFRSISIVRQGKVIFCRPGADSAGNGGRRRRQPLAVRKETVEGV
jgi:hypothetical protein